MRHFLTTAAFCGGRNSELRCSAEVEIVTTAMKNGCIERHSSLFFFGALRISVRIVYNVGPFAAAVFCLGVRKPGE